jgi:histidyl-tRNA synthetase
MQRPKGTRDLFGDELAASRHVEEATREVFRRYGYEEVDTPIFENFELFEKKSGSTVIKQVYAFEDKSGKMLALRPEITPSAMRFYINELKSAPRPVKLCYMGSCFRYEEPQAQRWRQFSQAGLEMLGSDRPEADAEVIALVAETLRALGLHDFELKVGHVKILRNLLEHVEVKGDKQDPILRAIDRKDDARLEAEMKQVGMNEKDKETLRAVVNLRGGASVLDQARKLMKNVTAANEAFDNLAAIFKNLHALGEIFTVDLGVARGLDYYTGAVFEAYVGKVQVAGGGRYDELVELLGGKPCPAVGVGFGIDRIARVLVSREKIKHEKELDCMVLPAAPESLGECLKIAQELRRRGMRVDVELMGRKLTKALAYAHAKGSKKVIIAGPKDLEKGEVTVRDMATGEQAKIPREGLAKRFTDST